MTTFFLMPAIKGIHLADVVPMPIFDPCIGA
jgi:hypothetical protein